MEKTTLVTSTFSNENCLSLKLFIGTRYNWIIILIIIPNIFSTVFATICRNTTVSNADFLMHGLTEFK